jgi:arylsulfatase A-like enzyme
VGAIFSGAHGAPVVEGTLPLAAVGQGGVDGADLMFSVAWSDDENEHGRRGLRAGRGPLSNHGSASPWELHSTLILAGPSFAEGVISEVPAGNIDIAPTLVSTLGLDPGAVAGGATDGRVLHEALRGGPSPETVETAEDVIESAVVDGQRQIMQRSRVGHASYLDGALSS